MRIQLWPLFLSAFAAADLQDALDSALTGDDFEFEATYPSGLKLSTSDDDAKRGVLPYEEVTDLVPEIKVKGLDEEARKKRYVAFVIMSRIPTIDLLDDVVWGCPWTGVNLTIKSDGGLDWGDEYTGGRTQDVDFAEVRNGTLHLWEHTEEVDEVLNEKMSDGFGMPNWFHILRIWQNRTDVPPFKLANIDFKFQNTKGLKRCDVSVTGAPIPGVEVGDDESCDKTPTPEKTESKDDKDDAVEEDDKSDESGNDDGKNDNTNGNNGGSDSSNDDGDEEDAGSMLSVDWPLATLALCYAAAIAAF